MIKDRIEAGQLLVKKLLTFDIVDPLVLAIPRGGVIVGHEIAKKLKCKLDIVVSKKITPPENPEYGIGAITYDGTLYKGEHWHYYADADNFDDEISKKKMEVKRRLEEYRGNVDYKFEKKTIILVDDGIATGSTVFVILNWLVKQKINEIFLAIPVMPASTFEVIKNKVSSIITLEIPIEFSSVGQFYKKFEQVSDEEVKEILVNYKN
ncbi:MAG: Phosphoribosyltransferase [Nitrosopumilales archaeon]|nr:MAG: Phosphoribosyltransferase [Nitrosopumilales archaeon]